MENISRRDFMKTAGLATLIGVTGCATTPKSEDYAFNEFKGALGSQYATLDQTEKTETREFWEEREMEGKKLLVDFYTNPDKAYHEIFEVKPSKESKKEIERITQIIYSEALTDAEFKDEISTYPWMDSDELSRKDAIFLGTIDYLEAEAFISSRY